MRPSIAGVLHGVEVLLRVLLRVVDRVPAVGAPVYVGRDEAGLVVRVRGESDRRVWLVQATGAGRAVTDEEDETYRGSPQAFSTR